MILNTFQPMGEKFAQNMYEFSWRPCRWRKGAKFETIKNILFILKVVSMASL